MMEVVYNLIEGYRQRPFDLVSDIFTVAGISSAIGVLVYTIRNHEKLSPNHQSHNLEEWIDNNLDGGN